MKISRPILLLLILSFLQGEIIYETGSLRDFIGGESSGAAYDNYVSHIVEGLAVEGYNDYGPDWLDVQSDGFGNYTIIPGESSILNHWQSIFQYIMNGDTTTADSLIADSLDTYNYDLVWFTDSLTNRSYCMVRERLDLSYVDLNITLNPDDDVYGSFRNGWGLYIINPNASRSNVVIQVPHPCDDFISPYMAIDAFIQSDARAFMISGTGREVRWTESGDYNNNKSLSDPTRNSNTVFHTFHRVITESLVQEEIHSPIVLQFHSFDNESHPNRKAVILSAGAEHPISNKPIRDVSSSTNDIINFTGEFPIDALIFGVHGAIRIDQYYEVNYDDICTYDGEVESIPLVNAGSLLGTNRNVQLNHTHSLHNPRDVYEPFVHIEMDEKPEVFDFLSMSLDTLYGGMQPTTIQNFALVSEYFQPFLDAIESYLSHWENDEDNLSPPEVELFYPTDINQENSRFSWIPVDDTNFKSYRIAYDPDEVTNESPFFDREDYSVLADMRTSTISLPNNLIPDTCQLAIWSVDYFGNTSQLSEAVPNYFPGHGEPIPILTFTDSLPIIQSYGDQDVDPEGWRVDTLDNEALVLTLTGNTWKSIPISPVPIDSSSVWSIRMKINHLSEIQGVGLSDGDRILWYSLYGTEKMDIEEWVTVYQGYFPEEDWVAILLPAGDDWFARHDESSMISEIILVNDADENEPGEVSFQSLMDLTPDLYISPEVSILHSLGRVTQFENTRNVEVSFTPVIDDPDSYVFTYLWHLGDGNTSTASHPVHTYVIEDDHTYSVVLEVTDQQGKIGRAYASIQVDEGETSLPLTMNFVGDIMLARRLEEAGGIIPTLGVNALFDPTLDLFGNAADISIANLESPLTDLGEEHPTKPIVFRGAPENVEGLVHAGIDVITLANNHIMDYGKAGMNQTQDVLEDAGILHSGSGINSTEAYQPIIMSRKGVSTAFLASSDRTGQYNNYQPYLHAGLAKPGFAYMSPYYIRKQIQEVEDVADLIVMEFHAGSEYSSAPGAGYDSYDPYVDYGDQRLSKTAFFGHINDTDEPLEYEDYSFRIDVPHMWDREIRQFAIDEGADLVIVHHPHIMQGIEVYEGSVITHSLGNFVFDTNYPETMHSIILQAEADPSGFIAFSADPVFLQNYIPVPAQGDLALYILDDLAMKSNELSTLMHVDRISKKGDVILDPMGVQGYSFTNRREFRMEAGLSEPISIHQTGGISLMNYVWPENVSDMRFGRELIWFGNMEDEGASLWNVNSVDESIVDDESYLGQRSIHHVRNPDSGDNIVTNFIGRMPIRSVTPVSLSGWIKTQNGSDVSIQARFYGSRYSSTILLEEDIGVWVTDDSEWTYYSNTFDPPEDANFFDIRCNSGLPGDGEAHSWFDNVSLLQWEDWLPVYGDMIIPHPNDYHGLQLSSVTPQDTTGYVEYLETYLGNPGIVSPDFSAVSRWGQVPLYVEFKNKTSGLNGWWEWDFGDGHTSIAQHPNHTYNLPGIYTVTLTTMDYNSILVSETKQDFIVCTTTGDIMRGDVNLDQTVNVLDIISCINLIFENTEPGPEQFASADMNADYKIDLFDLLMLSDFISEQ